MAPPLAHLADYLVIAPVVAIFLTVGLRALVQSVHSR